MRFLLGLLVGSLSALFVATTFNGSTQGFVEEGKSHWNDFLLATGGALFEFPAPPAASLETVRDNDPMDNAPDNDVHPLSADEIPVATANNPSEVELQPDRIILPKPSAPKVSESVAAAEVSAVDFALLTQEVWTPFRSQMSAQGFARRLTGKLNYPFSVNREGPGRYQVSFAYASEFERRDLLEQVASVTGQAAQ